MGKYEWRAVLDRLVAQGVRRIRLKRELFARLYEYWGPMDHLPSGPFVMVYHRYPNTYPNRTLTIEWKQ
jgi:hypothetical protein